MTMKTKRTLAAGGGTVLCAALAILIAARFASDDKELAANAPESNSEAQISVEIPSERHEEIKSEEAENTESGLENSAENPDEIHAEFIESGGIEIEQNFPETEPETEENEPPAPPEIEDEDMLTNPDAEPIYKLEQIEPQQTELPSDTPKHGDTKDGKIYINGFGWVVDEGGSGSGEPAPDMYENGNKIGIFG